MTWRVNWRLLSKILKPCKSSWRRKNRRTKRDKLGVFRCRKLKRACSFLATNTMTYRIYTPLPSKNLAILTLQFDHVTVKTIYKSVKLERKDCIKYLGVLKDENLSWKKHIVTVASKISKTIGMLSKLRHFIPSSVLVNIYNELITIQLT